MSFQEREYRPPSRGAQQAYERGSASGSILAEMGGGQCVTIATAARVGLPCDIIDGRAQCVESRKELRFRDFRSAEFGIGHHERVSLDEEPHLKHTLVAKKTDGVSFSSKLRLEFGNISVIISVPLFRTTLKARVQIRLPRRLQRSVCEGYGRHAPVKWAVPTYSRFERSDSPRPRGARPRILIVVNRRSLRRRTQTSAR